MAKGVDMTVEQSVDSTPSKANGEDAICEVQATVHILDLAIVHLQMAMTESDDAVGVLGDSFPAIAADAQVIREAAGRLRGDSEAERDSDRIVDRCEDMERTMRTAIVSFQFYDRMIQRLSHVRDSLTALGALIGDSARISSPGAWNDLRKMIWSSYSMESERAMFDALMNGASMEQALALVTKPGSADHPTDIDLF
jgi:hypothetical protein